MNIEQIYILKWKNLVKVNLVTEGEAADLSNYVQVN